jgi:hypothetical protein
MAGTLAQWITRQDPADRQGIVSIAIPQRRTSADLQSSLSLAIPVQSELLPDRFRVQFPPRGSGKQWPRIPSELL